MHHAIASGHCPHGGCNVPCLTTHASPCKQENSSHHRRSSRRMRSSKRSGGGNTHHAGSPHQQMHLHTRSYGTCNCLIYYFIPLAIRPRAYEYVKKTLRAIYVTAHEGLPSLVDEFCVTHTIYLWMPVQLMLSWGPGQLPPPPAMRPRA